MRAQTRKLSEFLMWGLELMLWSLSSISPAVCWSLSYQLFISMSVSDTVTLSTLVILAWTFFKHLFLTELYSHVNTLKSFKSSSFVFGPQTKLSLTFTVSLLVSHRIVTSSLLLLLHLEVNVFPVQRDGGGAACRCVQIPKHLVWNDADLLTCALKKYKFTMKLQWIHLQTGVSFLHSTLFISIFLKINLFNIEQSQKATVWFFCNCSLNILVSTSSNKLL